MIGDNFMWFPEKSSGAKVEGESTDTFFAHKKAFELRSFQFTMDNKDAVDSGSKGSVAGRAKFQEFEIEKDVDSASVPLYKACSLGTLIPTVMLAVRKAGGSSLLYLQYIFRYVHVTGITWSGGSGDSRASEKMTFSFKAMGFQYIAQAADGGWAASRPGPGTRPPRTTSRVRPRWRLRVSNPLPIFSRVNCSPATRLPP